MDFEKEKKRQTIRLIFTEALMVLSAVAMVLVLVLVVSGYWINENFEVERSGMLQISSVPGWANVTIDGQALSQHTSVNRVIPTGEHTVTVTKDGVKEGLLYRLQYPRLFPVEHKTEKMVLDFEATRVSISPKRDQAIVVDGTTKWKIFSIDDENMGKKELDLANILGTDGVIQTIQWSDNQNRVLVKVAFSPEKSDWILIDLNNPNNSINLSTEFGVGFSRVEIADSSADTLLVQRDGSLQKINVNDKAISAILVESVENFYSRGDEVVFIAKNKEDKIYAGFLKLSKAETKTLFEVENVNAMIFLSNFYDAKYITVVDGAKVMVFAYDNFETAEFSFELGFVPEGSKIGRAGEFVVMNKGTNMATLDMESETIKEWTVENESFGWLDSSLIYVVESGELIVYDFDGLNRRAIVDNVANSFPVTIAGTKWLYYVCENNLVREVLVER